MFCFHTVHSSYVLAGDRPVRRRLLMAACTGVLALLGACAAPKPVTTPVALTLAAAPNVNPDRQGRASPVVTRYYVLKAPGAFEAADFFSLQDKDAATLGADLVQREEVILRPGERRSVQLTLGADVKALGFMGGYRDLTHARWLQSVPLTPGQPLALTVTYGARGIELSSH